MRTTKPGGERGKLKVGDAIVKAWQKFILREMENGKRKEDV